MAWHRYTGPTGSYSFEGRPLVAQEIIFIPKTHQDFDPAVFESIDAEPDGEGE